VVNEISQPNIGLGTVQFGLPYGIHSNKPLMEDETVDQILSSAVLNKINFFDTAADYGCSEKRIGKFISKNLINKNDFIVSTKIPKVEEVVWDSNSYFDFIKKISEESLVNLNLEKHKILQFHQCDLKFLSSHNVKKIFKRILDEKICDTIGISVYTPEQAFIALDIPYVKAIQIPVNILDRRLLNEKLVNLYKERNIFVIARSVFLQGILTPTMSIPDVKQANKLLNLKKLCLNLLNKEQDIQKISLDFLFNNIFTNFIKVGLIGVNSVVELNKNLNYIQMSKELNDELDYKFMEIGMDSKIEPLLNPSFWNSL
jgi:aryl-alcohol dehydrogenase-like predicted oxidoreductase